MDFETKLKKYADVLVRIGANILPGKPLFLQLPVTDEPSIRRLGHYLYANAYDAGAEFVKVHWIDETFTKLRLEHAPEGSFEIVDRWRHQALHEIVQDNGSLLAVRASDPDLLQGQDVDKLATLRAANSKARKPTRKLWDQGTGTWSLCVVAFQEWADKVFPDKPEAERVPALWELIFRATRIDQDDPVAAWDAHSRALIARAKALTDRAYHALHFTAPGTDLTVGLAEGHVWLGGGDVTQDGRTYMPNIPTEEVFTMPHRDRVDGTVTASMPLNYGGALIEDFSMKFEGGKVVDFRAKRGEAVLRNMLDTDEGARRLGEVALVPHSSPISQMGVLFYNTLFDENASCHIALGNAYLNTMADGPFMSDEDFAAQGGNSSLVHTDFMIGSGAMDIDGIKADGSREPVMRSGEWAFEV